MRALILLVLFSQAAFAECKKEYKCDEYGDCDIVQVCDSTVDLPAINIPDIREKKPAFGLKPLPSVALPPLGTQKCSWQFVGGIYKNICQ